ncbi:MAG TPA: hypothetical protein VGG57_14710 [Stellaceae bacterium]|jgi:hypothetical protein
MVLRLHRGAIALCLAAVLALGGGSARAVEAGPGTKNFNVPPGVPDHFSNEAEPFKAGPAAEGPVPRSTVSRGPRARDALSRRGRGERGRVVHGRVVHGRVVHGLAVHGRVLHGHVVASRSGHRGRAVSHVEHGHAASHAKTAARPHVAAAKRRG